MSIQLKSNTKKWLITILLVIILLLFAAGGIFAVSSLKGGKMNDMPVPYDMTEEMYESSDSKVAQAPGFASSLCVSSEDNIGLEGVTLSSQAFGGLFDIEKGEVLFAQGMHEKIFPASITKIMTAIIVMNNADMNTIVTVPDNAVNLEEGSTELGLMPGDSISVENLFHGLLIYSGNDAAMTLAENVGGSVEAFVQMMNDEAARIGATNTHFMNPTGLHDENHYTTVYDIYLMLNEAMKYPEFVSVMQKDSYNLVYKRGEEELTKAIFATDQYLTKQVTPPKNANVLGGKTGTTNQAGACLALVSQNAYGEHYISIVTHAPTKTILYDNMNQLLSQINL